VAMSYHARHEMLPLPKTAMMVLPNQPRDVSYLGYSLASEVSLGGLGYGWSHSGAPARGAGL
jgi:hypothetical protein